MRAPSCQSGPISPLRAEVRNSAMHGHAMPRYGAFRKKNASSVRREPLGRPKSRTTNAHSPTQRGATGAHYKTQGRRRRANAPLPKAHRRHRIPPPLRAPHTPTPTSTSRQGPKPPETAAGQHLYPPDRRRQPPATPPSAAPSRTSPSAAAAPPAAAAANFGHRFTDSQTGILTDSETDLISCRISL